MDRRTTEWKDMNAGLTEVEWTNPRTGKCRARKAGKKPKIQPQLPEGERPAEGVWKGSAYTETDGRYHCKYCSFSDKRTNTIQQHCVCHFPPTHGCEQCGDVFHLKSGRNQHVLDECGLCGAEIRASGIKAHMKTNKCNTDAVRTASLKPGPSAMKSLNFECCLSWISALPSSKEREAAPRTLNVHAKSFSPATSVFIYLSQKEQPDIRRR